MGSVPIHMPKLFLISFLIEILAILGMISFDWDGDWVFLFSGFVYFAIIYGKYRNQGARHHYEKETKRETSKLRQVDDFIKSEHGLSNSRIHGANNTKVNGSGMGNNIMTALQDATPKGLLGEVVNKSIPNDKK